jgi:protein O-mannosyl-transferase
MKHKNITPKLEKSSVQEIKYPFGILIAVSIVLYIKSLNFGLTELDDSIFIKDFHDLFSDIKNLGHLFFRGVFFETDDAYYRPLLMVSFMFNKLVTGNLFGYHVTNLFFHIAACTLLYTFLLKLKLRADISFILALIFTVHPVLSQAVVWIPGRNDSMLTTFALASFIALINFKESKKWFWLPLHFVLFFAAVLTKESGIILPIMCLAYCYLLTKTSVKEYIILLSGWTILSFTWLYMRSISIDPIINPTASEYATGFIHRLPLFIHYIGKSILPFNLSVFPMQYDTNIVWGIVAIILCTAILVLNKHSNKKRIVFGGAWFVLFLLPAFFVPTQINEQAFEHRMYLPIIGILILLSETIVFSEERFQNQKYIFWAAMGIVGIFFFINIAHQQKFKNEITFWENAVIDSPSASYAHKILGVKYFNKNEFGKSETEISEALRIDSTERYANLYYAKILLTKNPKDPNAETYLLKEETYNPGFTDNLFELAKINFEKGDKVKAQFYLEECIRFAPDFMMAKNNLIILLMETNKKQEALDFINQWKKNKTGVPKGIEKEVNKMP